MQGLNNQLTNMMIYDYKHRFYWIHNKGYWCMFKDWHSLSLYEKDHLFPSRHCRKYILWLNIQKLKSRIVHELPFGKLLNRLTN